VGAFAVYAVSGGSATAMLAYADFQLRIGFVLVFLLFAVGGILGLVRRLRGAREGCSEARARESNSPRWTGSFSPSE